VQYVNDAGIDGHTCAGLGIDQIRLRSYATSHTRYRVDETFTGVQVMRYTQSGSQCIGMSTRYMYDWRVLFWNER